ncbi:protein kinase [Streptomyces sp. NPDC097619]|uniref:protein kinase domain-containing protein n=1 Tax=Streptomyces sp. NPDC097619 TaxID=3157228 RepID=UPI003320D5BC
MTTVPRTEWDPEGFGTDSGGTVETRRHLDRVPDSLADRLDLTEVVGEATGPARAVVLRVKDREARHLAPDVPLVLKLYHRSHAPDPQVRRALTGDLGGHVPRVLEHGTADGHPYELLPSYGETTLAQYHARRPGPLPPGLVRAAVTQLHAALTAVHDRQIAHRDLTPDNIVVRVQNDDRLDLVLVDFGAAVHTGDEDSAPRRPWQGKALYVAPEAAVLQQTITAAADWWSLGMITAELAGGRHPIDFRGEREVLAEIATHDPELPLVTDPRLLMLCQGLLTRAPAHRWGAGEVAEWLAGGSPTVVPRTSGAAPGTLPPPPPVEPFAFLGREFTGTEELARALDVQWRAAEDLLRGSRGRTRLTTWLAPFADAPGRSPEDAAELRSLTAELARPPAPATLLRLLNWMGPALPASWRGTHLDGPGIADLTRAVVEGDDHAHALVASLARHELLPLLAARPGGEGLDEVERRWRGHRDHWRQATADLDARGGPEDRRTAQRLLHRAPDLDARLLALAREPLRTTRELTARTTWNRNDGPCPTWYRSLRADPDHPLRLLAALLLHGQARREAEQRLTEIAVEEAELLLARETDARYAWLRRQDREPVLGWALLGATLLTAPWTFLIGLADLHDGTAQVEVVRAWLLALPAAAVVFALELWIALYIGPQGYHPRRSLAGFLIRTGGRPSRAARARGRLGQALVALALIAVVVTGTLAVTTVPWLWPLATVTALAAWTVHRALRRRNRVRSARGGPTAPHRPRPAPPTAVPPTRRNR